MNIKVSDLNINFDNVYEVLKHMSGEVIEAMHDYCFGDIYGVDREGKPIGLSSELADIVILCQMAADMKGIDLDKAVQLKLKYLGEKHGCKNADNAG